MRNAGAHARRSHASACLSCLRRYSRPDSFRQSEGLASSKVTTGAWLKPGDIGGMHRSLVYSPSQTIVAALVCTSLNVSGQANLPLYTDHLVNGFQNWSWGTLNFANTAPVHSGSDSVSLSGTAWNVALSLNHSGFDTGPYSTVTFWANGGAGGGQVLHVYAHV